MKKSIMALMATSLLLTPIHAEDDDDTSENARSSSLTPTAPRPVNMANPNKPTWQAEPHGK